MAISTINQAGLNAPLTLTSPVLNSPVISGTPTGSLVSANMPTGSVIQVVSTITTSYSNSTTPGFTDVTGMTATITPQFSTSRILVSVMGGGITATDTTGGNVQFILTDGSNNQLVVLYAGGAPAYNLQAWPSICFNAMFSPATTSALTYKVRANPNGGHGWQFNNYNTQPGGANPSGTITLMEIR